MRDPDLVQRAQRAAIGLERAWERWRVMHGFGAEPLPPVSSYVGYSLEEPWGQPRVVFGIAAEEAEKLAAILDGHDCVGPVHAEVSGRPEWRQQASQDWHEQPTGPSNGPGPGTGWPPPGTPLHVPAQPPQPESERDGARLGGSAREDHEPLADLPPFPEDPEFPAQSRDSALDEAALAETAFGVSALSDQTQFAAEFAAAPVPMDLESNGAPAAKPARSPARKAARPAGSQARATAAKASPAKTGPARTGSAKAGPAKTGQSDKAPSTVQAEPPVRRKTTRTSPLQMPKQMSKRVRSRLSAATAAADEMGAAEEIGPAIGEVDSTAAESTGSDTDE